MCVIDKVNNIEEIKTFESKPVTGSYGTSKLSEKSLKKFELEFEC